MSDAPKPRKKKEQQLVPAGIWRCPRCQFHMVVEVAMTCPPACGNHKGGHFAIMERVDKLPRKGK